MRTNINFKPIFKILPIPTDSVRKITRGYPLFIKLKNGKIEKVMKDILKSKSDTEINLLHFFGRLTVADIATTFSYPPPLNRYRVLKSK